MPHWLPLRDAAPLLSMLPGALRKLCERHQQRAADGAIESRFDGLIGRKIGGRWRILLSDAWTASAVVCSPSQVRDRRGRKEVGT
jgi:hypothetical protein